MILCGLPLLAPFPPTRPHARVARAGEEKLERDAAGPYPNELAGENFVVKWGDEGHVSEAGAALLLDAFEASWDLEVVEMRHPVPEGADDYLFNVYIGNTGSGTPDDYGAGGYYWVDDDGYPMVVVSQTAVNDTDYRQATAAHEFYHALQDAALTWAYEDDSAWYWEATACWAAGEVFPDNPDYATYLAGFAFRPDLGVEFFDYADSGAFSEYHQYGAFIFPRFLTEFVADRDLIRDSWVDAPGDSPLEAIDELLQDDAGLSLDEVFPDFAAHTAGWDYADRRVYEYITDAWARYYPEEDRRFIAEIDGAGTSDWQEPDADLRPRAYGYNVVRFVEPDDGLLQVEFESEEDDVSWGTTLVLAGDEEWEYFEFDGAVQVENPDAAEEIYLVMAPMTGARSRGNDYRWRMWVEEVAESDVDTDTDSDTDSDGGTETDAEGDGDDDDGDEFAGAGGCACGGGTSLPSAASLALVLVFTRRRGSGPGVARRTRGSPRSPR